MSEDDFIYWQDVLEDIAAGKTASLRCPFCQAEGLKVDSKQGLTRVECGKCRHYIEGRFPDGAGDAR